LIVKNWYLCIYIL